MGKCACDCGCAPAAPDYSPAANLRFVMEAEARRKLAEERLLSSRITVYIDRDGRWEAETGDCDASGRTLHELVWFLQERYEKAGLRT